jgi:rhodanese-related sulfurtransferase
MAREPSNRTRNYQKEATARTLKDMGYDRVYNLGGFKDWADSGGALEKVGEPRK